MYTETIPARFTLTGETMDAAVFDKRASLFTVVPG